MNYEKSSNCLDQRMKIITLEGRSAECGVHAKMIFAAMSFNISLIRTFKHRGVI